MYSIDMQCAEPGDVWESVYIYIYIYIYITEWVIENWWYENRTHAVTLAPMPLWTFILICTLSFTLISVLHIDVNGRGSTASSDVCANRPICASYKGLWCVQRILCDSVLIPSSWKLTMWDLCTVLLGLPLSFLQLEPFCFMYTCSYNIHTTIITQKYEINIKYL